jgi:hypothetical protein
MSIHVLDCDQLVHVSGGTKLNFQFQPGEEACTDRLGALRKYTDYQIAKQCMPTSSPSRWRRYSNAVANWENRIDP